MLATIEQNNDERIKVYLHFLFDGTQDEFNADFSSGLILKLENTERIELASLTIFAGGSDRAAILKAKEIIDSRVVAKRDYIYLLENDYLHTSGWVACLADLFWSSTKFDYVSLYDHGDKYPNSPGFLRRYSELRSRIFVTRSRHWRTAPSTCFSFLTRKDTFQKDWPLINIGHPDHVIFRVLREVNKRVLITPVPGLSTHCMSAGISPVIDWEMLSAGAWQRSG